MTAEPLRETEEAAAAWGRGAPIAWPSWIDGLDRGRRCETVAESAQMFDRLRDGARWLDECEQQIDPAAPFVYTSSTVDRDDKREIERLFVDAVDDEGGVIGEDITARLGWIADDEVDLSLRIRFSFGHESLREWLDPTDERALSADRFAAAVFEECSWIDTQSTRDRLARLHGRSVRLSERIVYGNAPGGGAVFHHDADPNQRGVLFAQLVGHTAWLVLPTAELEQAIVAFAPAEFGEDEHPLAGEIGPALWQLLNATPAFTATLAERDALFVLAPGDALVLPSPTPGQTAWHSVFALGDQASLAHSYGVFDAFA